uniref:Teneurin N-terminal domain-containing protein n=1 Tax=Capra hircus TaxID=9925 RepID=A0A8C2R132_CAPHI
MDVKERRPYCSLTKNRREKERRYTNSSADNEECRVPTQKSYSSSETLKAFDHDSSRLLYGNRVKDLVHREADEFSRQGQNFTLRQLGVCEPATRRGLAFCAEMGLPHRGYSISAGSDADTENEAVMSPEHAMRLWGRGVKSGRSSCLSSRSNSALTLTDTEHENKSDSETDRTAPAGLWRGLNGQTHYSFYSTSVFGTSLSICLSLEVSEARFDGRYFLPAHWTHFGKLLASRLPH